jgi:penicillin amidase
VLGGPVDVVRDAEGVVHVYASSDEDAFYASGYMQATDRLFQMDLQRRLALGRRAEVLGADAKADDVLIRTLGIAKWGRVNAEEAKSSSPEVHARVRAWTAGVNARIEEVRSGAAPKPVGFSSLGYEPERWEEADAFTVGKAIVFSNGNQLEFDVLATLIQKYNPAVFASAQFYAPLSDTFIVPAAQATSGQASSGQAPQWASGGLGEPPVDLGGAPPAGASVSLRAFVERMGAIRPGASNNWAVSPEFTNTGKSLIAGDPHQPLRSPSLMWLHHMSTKDRGGSLDVIGWTFVGTPGISIGHNDRVAWTATTNYPDVTDLFDVETDGAGMANIGGEWRPITSREETIEVSGGSPTIILVEEVEGYGVLLPADISPLPLVGAGHRVLFSWTGFRPTREAEAFFEFDRSTTLPDFEAAVDKMELGSFNFVAATADAITYRSSPLVPDRGSPATHQPAYRMMDGADKSAFWTGAFLPPDKMPRARGGEAFLVSANNDPFGFTADGILENDPWYFGAYFDPGTRAGRISAMLSEITETGVASIEDMQRIQSDTRSLLADEVLADLDVSWAKVETDPALAPFRDRPDLVALQALFAAWDHRMERSSTAAAAFEAFIHFYVRNVIADDMDIFFDPVLDSSPIYMMKFALLAARDPQSSLLAEGKDQLLLQSLSDTADHLTARYGAVDANFTWADAHETHIRSESIEELDGGRFATDGAEGTVDVSQGRFFDGDEVREKHTSSSGAIYRMTATFDDDGKPRAYFNMPGGASGEPGSAFFADRTPDWLEDRYVLLRFKRADVDAGTVETLRLEPK